jgi:non-lysosomal glucosylceramidase
MRAAATREEHRVTGPNDSRFNLPAHYAGVPLGGLGTGCIELGEDARFRNVTINNNRTAASRIPFADGAFIAIRAATGNEAVSRILQPQTSVAFERAGVSPTYSRPGDFNWYGLYPSSNFKLTTPEFPIETQWSCLSPLIPYDTEASTLPVVLCAMQFVNSTDRMYSVSALFNWENLRGCYATEMPAERGRIQPVSFDDLNEKLVLASSAPNPDGPPSLPVGLAFAPNEPCTQNPHGSYCLATPSGSGARVTLQVWDKNDADEARTFWKSFSEFGSLTDRFSDRPAAHCGSVCAAFHLAPGETRRVQFVLAWYFPVYRVDGVDLGNAYTNEHPDALSIASHALKHTTYFQRAVSNWQQKLLKSSLPPWYSRLLLDSCHVFSTNSIYTKSGEFAMMESPQEPALGVLARSYYASFGLLLFFPGLAGKELDLIARTAGAERGVCRDLGRGTPRKPTMPLPEDSPDLVAKFILLAYRNFHLTGKTVALMQLFPKLRELMVGAVRVDRDSDWIPESRGGLGMFPVWKTPPLNSYAAGLWVAAATAYTRLARHLRQNDDAEAWETRVRSALQTFEMTFWDEEEHCYRFGVDHEDPFFHFAGQFAGPWSDQFLHLDAGFSNRRVSQAIDVVTRANSRPGGVALGDITDETRPGAGCAWPMLSATCVACPQISALSADAGLDTLKEMQKESIARSLRSYNQPLLWDLDRHDAAGTIQDRHIGALAVWHSLYALQGFWLSVPEQRIVIAPRLPEGVTRVDLPLFTPAAFGRLLYEIVPETARQRFKVGFDSPVFIKTMEVGLIEARLPTRVMLRINDEPAAMQYEVIRARPRNRVKITLQTPLQVQHPIDLWIE